MIVTGKVADKRITEPKFRDPAKFHLISSSISKY